LMEDDLVSSLTYQVKEEVIQNYVMERRLIDLQIEDVRKRAAKACVQARVTGKRLNRLALLMIRPEMLDRLMEVLPLPGGDFWKGCLEPDFSRKIRLIQVSALTRKRKFRKLVIEAYARFYERMKHYRGHYEDLRLECAAVNRNIETFAKNFDLLAILNFLRNLDMRGLERKKILGENFTAKEVATLDRNLYIGPISLEKFDVPVPFDVPETSQVEGKLSKISDEIYRKYGDEVRKILE
jgi:hypothetical protein